MASRTGSGRRARDAQRALKDILIVDDEESLAFFLQQGLLEIDPAWVVDTANTGEEAVIKINRSIYRLIIADLRMPGLNGLELLQMVRALEPNTQVILMTAYGSDEIAQEAARLRVFRYVTKPFRIQDMKNWARESLHYQESTIPPAPEVAEPAAVPPQQEAMPVAEPETVDNAPEIPQPVAAAAGPKVVIADAGQQEVESYVTQLRFRMGAMYIFVADMIGQRIAEAGLCGDLDADVFAAQVAASLAAAMEAEQTLGGAQQPTVLLQRGQRYTACSVAAAPGWMLSAIYDHPIQGRRLEAVLRNIDQAVEALKPMLEAPFEPTASAESAPIISASGEASVPEADSALEAILAQPSPTVEMDAWVDDDESLLWDENSGDAGEGFFSLDEAQSLGLVDDELLAKLQGK